MNRAKRRTTPYAAALTHHAAGRLPQAKKLYTQQLKSTPNHADSLHLLGLIAQSQGNLPLAITQIRRAITLAPTNALYHLSLGTTLAAAGNAAESLDSLQKSLTLNPNQPDAHTELAFLHLATPALALHHFTQAASLAPASAEAQTNLGAFLKSQGTPDKALKYLEKAVTLAPANPTAHNNLGTALADLGRLAEAITHYQTALKNNPDFAEAHNNLGAALEITENLGAGLPYFQKAVAIKPDFAEAWTNLAAALANLQNFAPAESAFQNALQANPNLAEAHTYRATMLLAQGNMAEGWAEYEWRFKTAQLGAGLGRFQQPQWRGGPAYHRTLLVHAEQGFGDTLQFCRFAPAAAALGFRVILEVQPPLTRLLTCLPNVEIYPQGADLPEFDLQIPLMSLPAFLPITNTPYLTPPPEERSRWADRLDGLAPSPPRIGLAWAGNPRAHNPALAAVDRRRSLNPTLLEPLLRHDAQFFSLQKDGPPGPGGVINLMPEAEDFAATAGLIANLDLIIAADTAVAHLAAALGKPTWLLNRFDSCWRWLTNRQDSPWYPTMRLYTQPRLGDWPSVIANIEKDLSKQSLF